MELKDRSSSYFSYNFQKDVMDTFRNLRERSEGFDVILGCSSPDSNDVICMQAHKILIAASSPLLKSILESNDNLQQPSSPFLFLGEISQKDLNYILTYVYNGEVQVAKDDLDSFTATAQQLQIRGIAQMLADDGGAMFSNQSIGNSMDDLRFSTPVNGGFGIHNTAMPSMKFEFGTNQFHQPIPQIGQQLKYAKTPKLGKPVKVKKELNKSFNTPGKSPKTPGTGAKTPGSKTVEVKPEFKAMAVEMYKKWKEIHSTSDATGFHCHACPEGKSFTAASSLQRHYQQAHEKPCKTCKMPFLDENMMQEHYKATHEFKCDFCEKVFSARSSKDRHHQSAHKELL